MKPVKIVQWSVVIYALFLILCPSVLAEEWKELKGKHFIVEYASGVPRAEAQKILRKAEQYYRHIGREIGYARYENFWTWGDRVKIFIFADQRTFQEKTGQPAWSLGYTSRDGYVFKSKAIVSYYQETEFSDGVLPHEISHLIMRDFFGGRKIPVWFEEGIAQLQEEYKRETADQMMRVLTSRKQHVPLRQFIRWNGNRESETLKVMLFYAQSLSLVNFLITHYGSRSFGTLCSYIKDGETFESALPRAYRNSLDSLEELEEKWINSLKQ